MSKKVLVLGGFDYKSLFTAEGWTIVTSIEADPDLVCFTGGTDINPILYTHHRHPSTNRSDTERDTYEVAIFNICKARDIPMVGICRGSQLLCALSGGTLYQNVGQHCVSHDATTDKGTTMLVTSSHHQMMNPIGTEHQVLMSTDNRSVYYHEALEVESPEVDYEVVYFPQTRALAHQPHPEWMSPTSQYRRYFWETVDSLMAGGF